MLRQTERTTKVKTALTKAENGLEKLCWQWEEEQSGLLNKTRQPPASKQQSPSGERPGQGETPGPNGTTLPPAVSEEHQAGLRKGGEGKC